MRNRRGFTLVELLAVVVILAIIAVIAVPIVLNVIDNAKKMSQRQSVLNFASAVESKIYSYNMQNENAIVGTITQVNNDTIKFKDIELKVKYKGVDVICDTINVQGNGTIFITDCKVGDDPNYVLTSDETQNYSYGKSPYYLDKTLNGADPVLNELTPVVYKDGNWEVADINTKWYDYSKQQWANAVLLKEGVTKNVGETVSVDGTEALAMFVWIPRYEYKIETTYGTHIDEIVGTAELPGEIKINFINSNVNESSSGYRIHPAFTFGEKDLKGIWVGKFETTGSTTTPTILPGKKAINGKAINIYFQSALKFAGGTLNNDTGEVIFSGSSIYGLSNETDSHMMKNTEWGAVAYLSQSIYGKYGNTNYEGINKEVYVDGSTSFITGSSNGTPSTAEMSTIQYVYDDMMNNRGIGASTTGNITGIYDMNGGILEYVMGNYNNTISSSGFSKMPESKYYDLYTTRDSKTACNGICYGQALSETKNWYNDSYSFLGYPWVLRGGYAYYKNTSNGIFYLSSQTGGTWAGIYGFRVVLVK